MVPAGPAAWVSGRSRCFSFCIGSASAAWQLGDGCEALQNPARTRALRHDAGQHIAEIGVAQQRLEFGHDKLTQPTGRRGHFGQQFLAAVHHGEDVFEVVAQLNIVVASVFEGLQLGGQEVGR